MTAENKSAENISAENRSAENATTDPVTVTVTTASVPAGDTTSVLTAETVGAVIDRATFDDKGLLPAIVQQDDTGEVLMLGYMNAEALRRTLTEGRVTFWSRSRQEYWRKGDTSGHRQYVRAASLDCDGDTLLLKVIQIGPACHTGAHACFDVDPLSPRIGQPELDSV